MDIYEINLNIPETYTFIIRNICDPYNNYNKLDILSYICIKYFIEEIYSTYTKSSH